MGRPDLSLLSERRLRLANSSPDVKALFNAPAYIYNLEALEAASVSSTAGDDLGYGDGGGYGGTGEGQAAGGSVLGESDLDYWTPTSLVPIVSFHSFFFLQSIKLMSFHLDLNRAHHTQPPNPRCPQTRLGLAPRGEDKRTAEAPDAKQQDEVAH